ncbi:hypothetical protein DT075_40205 [Bacillus licheniformis]|nr:hypothetical protein DT075_40205 [Bacillus licheniformis]
MSKLGAIVADGNAKGDVRGYVSNPHVHFDLNEHGKLDVRRAVGTSGTLSVVKDLGLRDLFTGQVEIVSGEAIAYDGKVRAYAANTTETIHEAQRRHNTWPTASAALGRTMTAAVMLGAMLKGEDKLTVKIEGGGPICQTDEMAV